MRGRTGRSSRQSRAPSATITTLSRHFGFDAVETEGVIRFVIRGRASSLTLTVDDLAPSREGEALELVRAQETELPLALKWQIARADEGETRALIASIRALPADGIDLVALYTGNLVDGVVHALGAEYRPLY